MKVNELIAIGLEILNSIEEDCYGDSDEFKRGRAYGTRSTLVDMISKLAGITGDVMHGALVETMFQDNDYHDRCEADKKLILDKHISHFNLSVRTANCLDSARIETLRSLEGKSEDYLLDIRNMGKIGLEEIRSLLKELKLEPLSLGRYSRSNYDIKKTN